MTLRVDAAERVRAIWVDEQYLDVPPADTDDVLADEQGVALPEVVR